MRASRRHSAEKGGGIAQAEATLPCAVTATRLRSPSPVALARSREKTNAARISARSGERLAGAGGDGTRATAEVHHHRYCGRDRCLLPGRRRYLSPGESRSRQAWTPVLGGI